jgi:hypothetical protein
MVGVLHSAVNLTRHHDKAEWSERTEIPTELERVLRDLAKFDRAFLGHHRLPRWIGNKRSFVLDT